jgi:hypothetical protein
LFPFPEAWAAEEEVRAVCELREEEEELEEERDEECLRPFEEPISSFILWPAAWIKIARSRLMKSTWSPGLMEQYPKSKGTEALIPWQKREVERVRFQTMRIGRAQEECRC